MGAWPLLATHVVHFHVKDAVAVDRSGMPPYPARVPDDRLMDSVRLPGEGDGALGDLLHELHAIGYRGWLTIEPHLRRRLPEMDGPGRFQAALTALRGLLVAITERGDEPDEENNAAIT